MIDAHVPLAGAADHGVSEAVYLSDPDANGIELYRDRPREEWPRRGPGGGVEMFTRPLDLEDLLAEAGREGSNRRAPGRAGRLPPNAGSPA